MVSLCVALTGIGVPMGLSFILKELVGASSLQAFAAGAALSATSLGTTFTILSTTNLIATRLGTVTTSAAMLDDVVGLVMVQIISNLGGSGSSFDAITVIRPVFVSIGFAIGLSLLCAFFIGPCLKKALRAKFEPPPFIWTMQFAFLYQTLVLVGIVASASYAGTSSLFAAYLAGVIVTWFDSVIANSKQPSSAGQDDPHTAAESTTARDETSHSQGHPRDSDTASQRAGSDEIPTGELVYEKYYKQPVTRILIPLFFVGPLSYLYYPQHTHLSAGVNRVCNPHHGNVQRICHMAWTYLFSLNDVWEDGYRSMAGTVFLQSYIKSRHSHQGIIFPCPHFLYPWDSKENS